MSGLNAAFRDLRKQGLFARMNFMCCNSCALTALRETGHDGAYCFFHEQDNEGRVGGRPFYLSFGPPLSDDENNDAESRAVGWQVVAALAKNGVKSEWDGDPDVRIRVTPGEPA